MDNPYFDPPIRTWLDSGNTDPVQTLAVSDRFEELGLLACAQVLRWMVTGHLNCFKTGERKWWATWQPNSGQPGMPYREAPEWLMQRSRGGACNSWRRLVFHFLDIAHRQDVGLLSPALTRPPSRHGPQGEGPSVLIV